jgi:hypothetical protein
MDADIAVRANISHLEKGRGSTMATDASLEVPLLELPPELESLVEQLVTEDDTPVDSIFSEKQHRLLTESLHSSWPGPGAGRPFVAMTNVGLFYEVRIPPLVPDALLSLDVSLPADVRPKKHRSYFTWLYHKVPEVVIEVVSNREGGEDTDKLAIYAQIGVRYYAILDPHRLLAGQVLRVFQLKGQSYELMREPIWFPEVGLGLRMQVGRYEDMDATWLRWVDADGVVIPSGKEGAEAERRRADTEQQRADTEQQRADTEWRRAEAERQRAERLAEQLRRLGVDPREH